MFKIGSDRKGVLMRRFIVVAFFIALFILKGWANTPSSFVQVKGRSFVLNGQRYAFLGTNIWYAVNLGALAEGGNRARLIRELNRLKDMGVTNLRIMGASEGLNQPKTVWPPIQPSPKHYDQRLLEGLDFVLAEMAKRNMKAVIYLNNFWVWTGGMAQYVSWATKEPLPNAFLPQYTWLQFMNFSARFYSTPQAERWYEAYVKNLVMRKNTMSGVWYKDDPTIMAWELANEPRPGEGTPGKENFKAFAAWIRHAAALIRSLDGNHLITTGNEGLFGCMRDSALFLKIHNDPNIDYITFHLWAFNWGWFEPSRARATFDSALIKARHYVDLHIRLAEKLHKPLVLEEFGLPRDGHSFSPQATTHFRDRYYQQIFEWVWQNAQKGGPLIGSNFWGWAGEGRPRDGQHPTWQRGDSFTADPPQEPQGLNSVFDCDASTIAILKDFAHKMQTLK